MIIAEPAGSSHRERFSDFCAFAPMKGDLGLRPGRQCQRPDASDYGEIEPALLALPAGLRQASSLRPLSRRSTKTSLGEELASESERVVPSSSLQRHAARVASNVSLADFRVLFVLRVEERPEEWMEFDAARCVRLRSPVERPRGLLPELHPLRAEIRRRRRLGTALALGGTSPR